MLRNVIIVYLAEFLCKLCHVENETMKQVQRCVADINFITHYALFTKEDTILLDNSIVNTNNAPSVHTALLCNKLCLQLAVCNRYSSSFLMSSRCAFSES